MWQEKCLKTPQITQVTLSYSGKLNKNVSEPFKSLDMSENALKPYKLLSYRGSLGKCFRTLQITLYESRGHWALEARKFIMKITQKFVEKQQMVDSRI